MAKKIADGEVASLTLGANASSGDLIIQGNVIGVAVTSGETGDVIAVELEGVWPLPKKTGVAFSVGDALLWDASEENLTKTPSSDSTYVGIAYAAAASGDTTAQLLLMRPAAGNIVPQATLADVGDLTAADATGNTTGDINGVKNALLAHINTLSDKIDALLTKLETAGVLIA